MRPIHCDEELPTLKIASPCPHCGSRNGYFELGPSERPHYISRRYHCRNGACMRVHKQDIYAPDEAPMFNDQDSAYGTYGRQRPNPC